jgi:GntR family transcriptional regulator/MocR family aminotransferase
VGTRARAVIAVEEGSAPLFLRIARAIADDVRRGRLRTGEPLPGTRALADALGVNRNTVVAAYREIVAEGWAVARAGGGTFVADIPTPRPRALARVPRPTQIAREQSFTLRPDPTAAGASELPSLRPGTLVMAAGVPDVRLVERDLLARALRRVLTMASATDALGYGDPRGDPGLRRAVADLVREGRGVPASADNVLVVAGSQMALALVGQAIVMPGETIAVESFGYRLAWAAFARAGARVVPIPVDDRGLDVDALGALVRREAIRAVYVTPHHQYPTTVTLAPGRRLALLELARRERFAIIEDDYDHELHYEGRPVLPLASADVAGSVVYVGTLSKVLAPGLRLGYLVAPAPVIERILRDRVLIDRQGNHPIERAAAELIDDGTVARHVRRMRRIYAARRDLLVEELRRKLADRIEVRPPSGGLALWVRVRLRAPSVATWMRRSLEMGVAFVAGQHFTFDGRAVPFARLGFAALDEQEIREAVRRLERAFPIDE